MILSQSGFNMVDSGAGKALGVIFWGFCQVIAFWLDGKLEQ